MRPGVFRSKILTHFWQRNAFTKTRKKGRGLLAGMGYKISGEPSKKKALFGANAKKGSELIYIFAKLIAVSGSIKACIKANEPNEFF